MAWVFSFPLVVRPVLQERSFRGSRRIWGTTNRKGVNHVRSVLQSVVSGPWSVAPRASIFCHVLFYGRHFSNWPYSRIGRAWGVDPDSLLDLVRGECSPLRAPCGWRCDGAKHHPSK